MAGPVRADMLSTHALTSATKRAAETISKSRLQACHEQNQYLDSVELN